MNIAILKYNAGNIKSVEHALHRIGVDAIITDDADQITAADKVIFPGVGHAAPTMQYLKEKKLDILIRNLKQPVLGICLGQQLMCAHSEEGDTSCLNIFPVRVKKFESSNPAFKVPQVGWNDIYNLQSPLFKDIPEKSYVYFVHSYYCELAENVVAVCDYIQPFSAALHRNNFYATQFHPEKSAGIGQKILENFVRL